MYEYGVKDRLSKKLRKIAKKDRVLYEAIMKKILQVAENPYLGKPLHGKLKGKRRVQIGHFVLIYGVGEKEHRVIFLDFTHHNEAYKQTFS